jgi:hypothetical protein
MGWRDGVERWGGEMGWRGGEGGEVKEIEGMESD